MNTLNDFFDKIYCINLDRRFDKYNECIEEFKKLNIDVKRFSAIDGAPMFRQGLNLTAGAYGLMLTHREILKETINNNYKNVLILEDDVSFINDFYNYFNKNILLLPDDWDLLYLGGNNMFNKGEFKSLNNPRIIINKNNYRLLEHDLCKTTWTQTTHAVAINNKAFKAVSDSLTKFSNKPIDDIFCIMQQSGYNAYTFLPSLALQRPSMSDIENKYVDYNRYNDFNF